MITPPPDNFDVMQASPDDLRVYGYPTRPDIERYPQLHERWKQLVGQTITFVQPELAVVENGQREPAGRQDLVPRTKNPWSGSVVPASPQDPVFEVWGQWTVPDVVRPQNEGGHYYSSTWIGIDGAPVGEYHSTDILQAGTEQDVGGSGTYAWYEWYDEDPVKIMSIKVSPGDVMFCAIEVFSPTQAYIWMRNLTTRVGTVINKTATGTRKVVGDSVEWILETPQDAHHIPLTLPQFSYVYFDVCVAFKSNTLVSAGQGQFWKQADINDKVIAIAEPVTDHLFTVTYTA